MSKPNPTGSTFAERQAAREGKPFTAPKAEKPEDVVNTTFAERARAAKKTSSKAVDSDSDAAENKAVAKKATARKSKS